MTEFLPRCYLDSFWLAPWDFLYALSNRQDSTSSYHSLCYTSCVTTAFVIPVVEHWLELEISDNISHQEQAI